MSCSLSSKRSDYAELPHGRQQTQRPPNSAMRHNPAYGIMAKLMKAGAVVIDLLEEGRLRRQLDEICTGHIEGAIAPNADIRAGCLDHNLGMRDCFPFGKYLAVSVNVVRKTVALRDVEDGETLQERDCLRLGIFGLGALLLALGNEAVGMHDRGAGLAFPDGTAKRKRLPESQPVLAWIGAFDHRPPQDQDVDAGITAPGGGVPRQADNRFRCAPRFDPRHTAALEIGDDALRDLGIEVYPRLLALACATLATGWTSADLAHDLVSAPFLAAPSPEAGWAAKTTGKARRRWLPASAGPQRSGGPRAPGEGLRAAAAGLEGRAAHTAPPGRPDQEISLTVRAATADAFRQWLQSRGE